MASSFDKVINRMNTDSLKWDGMKERFGLIPDDTLPMWVADMDFLSPGPVIKALRERVEHGVFGYASDPRSVFDAVAEWMERVHGWTVDPSWIFTAPGVMPAIGMAIRALTSTGDKVVIMPPVYPPFFRIVEDNERILVQVPLIEEKGYYNMDFEGLERACRDKAVKMVLLCSPHNPVGRVWTARELDKLAEISEETETVIVSDEIHADLVHSGNRHIPYATRSKGKKRWITCVSPSKTFNIAGLECSALICTNPDLRKRVQAARRGLLGGVNLLGATAAVAAYRFGADWLQEVMEILEGNRDYLMRYLAENIPAIRMAKPEATYLAWLDCRALGLSESPSKFFLENAKVALNNGEDFGAQGKGFVRLNFGCHRDTLNAALERMRHAILN